MNTNEQEIIEDGGPAFPCPETGVEYYDDKMKVAGCRVYPASVGMSLRDWFAGQALASMTVAPDYSNGPCNQAMADRAYSIADAMLERRKK